MDRGAWKAAVHGVAKSRTRLSEFTFTFNFHTLEKEMATHSSVLAWRIPGAEPGSLPSMGLHRVRHDWSNLAAAAASSNQAVYSTKLRRELPLSDWPWAGTLAFSCLQTGNETLNFKPAGLWNKSTPLTLLGLQLTECRSWNLFCCLRLFWLVLFFFN